MAASIREWLSDLGLDEYAGTFEAEEIEVTVLSSLTDDDLRELGVSALGHRKKILSAAATSDEVSGPSSPAATETPVAEDLVAPIAEQSQAPAVAGPATEAKAEAATATQTGAAALDDAKAKVITKATTIGSEVGAIFHALRNWSGKQAELLKDKKRLPELERQLGQVVMDNALVDDEQLHEVRAATQAVEDGKAEVSRRETIAAATVDAQEKLNADKAVTAARLTLETAESDVSSALRKLGASAAARNLSDEAASPVLTELASLEERVALARTEGDNLKTTIKTNQQGVMVLAVAALVVLVILLGVFGGSDKTSRSSSSEARSSRSTSSSSSSSSRSSGRILTPVEAESILRGCCTGAGGTYAAQYDDCVIFSNQEAYTGCVGYDYRVRYPSGNVRTLEARYRP